MNAPPTRLPEALAPISASAGIAPAGTPAPPRFYWLAAGASALLLALFSTYGAVDRNNALSAGIEASRQISEQTSWAAEGTLDSARQLLEAIHLLTETSRNAPPHDPGVRSHLLRLKEQNPYVMDLLVIDRDGRITHWTGPGQPPAVTDRDYYAVHAGNPSSGLYIGPPLASKVHFGKTFFAMSAAIRGTQGRLEQVQAVIIDVTMLKHRLDAPALIEGSSRAVLTDTGSVYARVPDPQRYVGRAIPLPGLFDRLTGPDSIVTERLVSPLDRQDRIVTVRHVGRYPLIAAGTVPVDELLDPWQQRMIELAILWLGLSVTIFWLAHRVRGVHELQIQLATIDGLTGIYNRRTILEQASLLKRSERHSGTLSILLIDVDHFKTINDTFGHAAGDDVLRRLSDLLRQQIRGGDFVGRYGGEEFLILMPDTGLQGALTAAAKLRETVEAKITEPQAVTISIGAATTNTDAPTLEATLARADRALYSAKAAGRNCVRAAL